MKKGIFTICLIFTLLCSAMFVHADLVSDNGVNYLKSKQDTTGQITGWGGESQWAAIAFAGLGIDVSTIKNPTVSLKDFLLADLPSSTAAATEWERRILAIVAIGEDPTNFNGFNYLQKLESLSNNNQLGELTQINDDIFGLLALIASGSSANTQIKTDVLAYIISQQNSDGGFGWTLTPPSNTSDSNDTAAALQALQAAKNDGLTHANLDTSISNAKTYLLSLQHANGGFRYDTGPWSADPDGSSTAWSIMALNVLGLGSSTEAVNAKTWLNAQQEGDGGFHWMSGYGTDTATTSHALIALSGKGWLLTAVITPTPSVTATPSSPTATPTPTPTPTATPAPTTAPTSTPTPTTKPTATPTPTPSPVPTSEPISEPTDSPTPSPEVLGEATESIQSNQQKPSESPFKRGLQGVSVLSLASAIGFWYMKLKL